MPDERPAERDVREDASAALQVTAWGIERGAEYSGVATVSLRNDGVALALPASPFHGTPRVYRFVAIDGIRVESLSDDRALLTIFLGGGDVAELTGARTLRGLAFAIEDAACALAE